MEEPIWITIKDVLKIHKEQIKLHGGSDGVRDFGLLESAINKPKNTFHYKQNVNFGDLATSYLYGLCKNHPFIDGNKRVALVSMIYFIRINNKKFKNTPNEYEMVYGLANGTKTLAEISQWIKSNLY